MSEPSNAPAPAPSPAPAPAPNSNEPNSNPNPAPSNEPAPSALSDDQLKAAFEHPRFKELTEKANELKKLQDQKAADDAKALADQGKFQELAEKHQAEATDWKSKYENSIKQNAVIVAANKLGAHDANTVAKLVDSGAIQLADDGTVSGVDEAVAALQTANPYLFKTGSTTKIGGGDTNPQGGGNAEYTASQFADHAFYQENQKAMDKAMSEGRVDLTK